MKKKGILVFKYQLMHSSEKQQKYFKIVFNLMFLQIWRKKCNSSDWHQVVTHLCERVTRTDNSHHSATYLQTTQHHLMKSNHVTTWELNSLFHPTAQQRVPLEPSTHQGTEPHFLTLSLELLQPIINGWAFHPRICLTTRELLAENLQVPQRLLLRNQNR